MIRSLNEIIDIEDILLQKAMKRTSIEELSSVIMLSDSNIREKILSNVGINAKEMIKQQTADIERNKADQKFVNSFIEKINQELG